MFKSISLYTDKLKQLHRFYMNMMDFKITESTNKQFTMQIGTTSLTFIASAKPANYHFAINVPGNQFVILKDWLNTRYKLSREGGIDQIYYPKFNADALFIEDPAGNLVEFIGRRNRDLFGELTREAFYDISEIALVTPHVFSVGEQLQDIGLALQEGFEANPEVENYLGEDDHFIVLMKEERKIDFLQEKLNTHPLTITLNNKKIINLKADGTLAIK